MCTLYEFFPESCPQGIVFWIYALLVGSNMKKIALINHRFGPDAIVVLVTTCELERQSGLQNWQRPLPPPEDFAIVIELP